MSTTVGYRNPSPCTSGRRIREIDTQMPDEPCGKQLLTVPYFKGGQDVKLCAHCDGGAADLALRSAA